MRGGRRKVRGWGFGFGAKKMLALVGVLTLLGVVICGYGYAALSSEVMISGEAVVAPNIVTLSKIKYLQDMTPAICDASAEYETAQIKDKRDEKSYWVIKLRDIDGGKCWMMQNLELELTAGVALTPELTDVAQDWAPGFSTDKTAPSGDRNPDELGTKSFLEGLWVLKTPTQVLNCGYQATGIAACAHVGFVQVGNQWADLENLETDLGWQAATDPNFFWAESYSHRGQTLTKASGVAVDEANKVFDAHYLTGVYYQFNAAVVEGDGAKRTDRGICPKGWKIAPGNTSSPSWHTLFYYTAMGGGYNNSTMPPYHIVRAGRYDMSSGFMWGGYSGSLWTSQIYYFNRTMGYSLHIATSMNTVFPAMSSIAMPTRCVARQAWDLY